MQTTIAKEKNFISAVLYMNSSSDSQTFSVFVKKLSGILSDNFNKYEIICVDDDCQWDYEATLHEIRTAHSSPVTILHMSHYQGIEIAMNAGRDLAIGDFVIEFDECIWNFPDDMIMRAYERCLQDIDIVVCSDTKKGNIFSSVFYSLFNHFSNFKYQIKSENFKILSRRSINRIQSLNKTVPYRKALYANSGLTIDSLIYTSGSRTQYTHNTKMRKSRRALASDSLLLFTDIGYKASLTLSLLMVVIMVLCALYAIVIYKNGIAIEGWTTTMLFLSFAFFGLFTILTIVIKYLSLLLNLSFKRNKYLYSNIEKLN